MVDRFIDLGPVLQVIIRADGLVQHNKIVYCEYMMCECSQVTVSVDQPSLTTVCLVSSTISRSSLYTPGPISPPNIAALLSPTGVRVKLLHGGGGCPVTLGELHFSMTRYIQQNRNDQTRERTRKTEMEN